jgi:hypothetical protein
MGSVRIITPTQLIMDRIAAFTWWKDQPSLQQAVDVARNNPIEWQELYEWVQKEGIPAEVIDDIIKKSSSRTTDNQGSDSEQ